MREYLQEGDLVSAEVHKVQHQDGSLQLHTRSFRYGKLENGVIMHVTPGRIPRRKNHYTDILDGKFQVLLGCNGSVWIQRHVENSETAGSNSAALTVGAPDLAELEDDVPIIAYEMNGKPMSRREKGPLWIVYPYDSAAKYRTELAHARSVWQLDRLDVLE